MSKYGIQKVVNLMVMMLVLLVVSSVFATAAVTYTIVAPATGAPSSTQTVTLNVDTGGDTVADMQFTLQTSAGMFSSNGVAGTFASADAFPTFSCTRVSANTQLACTITGTSGKSGLGNVLSVPLTLPATGSVGLSLVNPSASDDLGNLLLVALTVEKTITVGAPVCVPESDVQFCARLGKNCDAVTANDNCGQSRTVASCGTCTTPQTCGGSNTLNVCGSLQSPCGNGQVDTGELCDPTVVDSRGNLGGITLTCQEYDPRFTGGTLTCNYDCTLNTQQCTTAAQICTPSRWYCEGNSHKQCNTGGTGFNELIPCLNGQTCTGDGQCVSSTPTAGSDLGTQIADAVNQEATNQGLPTGSKPRWTTVLISRLASILKLWFNP